MAYVQKIRVRWVSKGEGGIVHKYCNTFQVRNGWKWIIIISSLWRNHRGGGGGRKTNLPENTWNSNSGSGPFVEFSEQKGRRDRAFSDAAIDNRRWESLKMSSQYVNWTFSFTRCLCTRWKTDLHLANSRPISWGKKKVGLSVTVTRLAKNYRVPRIKLHVCATSSNWQHLNILSVSWPGEIILTASFLKSRLAAI